MLRPHRNGSKPRGFLRSNSQASPAPTKDYVKPYAKQTDALESSQQLPVETLKKPLNNYLTLDLQKTQKQDNWVKPLVSISLENGSDIKNRLSHVREEQAKQKERGRSQRRNSDHPDMQATVKPGMWSGYGDANVMIRFSKQIVPAIRQDPNRTTPIPVNNFMRHLDDDNSVITAYLKNNFKDLPKFEKAVVEVKNQGPAQTKLKSLMNASSKPPMQPSRVQSQPSKIEEQIPDDVSEDIQEVSEEDYLKEQFQSVKESINSKSKSGSMIKQSIKADSSIKESMRTIKESIRQSFPKSKFSGSIQQSIYDQKDKLAQSNNIIEESIQAYQDDFEASHSKQESPAPRKLNSEESLSRSFRKKKSAVVSLRGSDQVVFRKPKESALQESLIKIQKREDRTSMDKLKTDVKQLMGKSKRVSEGWDRKQVDSYSTEKVNSLYNKFKFQLGRFMNNKDLQTKVKKLVSFFPGKPEHSDNPTNAILVKILDAINDLKRTSVDVSLVEKIQGDYNAKLELMLSNQGRLLRMDMQRRLDEKDSQMRILIQGVKRSQESGLAGREKLVQTLRRGKTYQDFLPAEIPQSQRFDYKSYKLQDYSEQYSQISWQSSMDLWENIPLEQKRRMYQKDSDGVIAYLTKILTEQIKHEAIERSVDISFEFPSDLQVSMEKESGNTKAKEQELQVKMPQPKQPVRKDQQIEKPILSTQKATSSEPKQPSFSDYQIKQPPTTSNKKVTQKAKQVMSKYYRKIKPKCPKLFKQVYQLLNDSSMTSHRVVHQTRILDNSEVDILDKEYIRGYQQNIIGQIVLFLSNNPKPFKQLQTLFKDRVDHLLEVAKVEYLGSIEVAIASSDKSSLPKGMADLLNHCIYNRLQGQQPHKEFLCEYEDNRERENTKKMTGEMILNMLVEEVAREIKARK